jgi:hypothetical protein
MGSGQWPVVSDQFFFAECKVPGNGQLFTGH